MDEFNELIRQQKEYKSVRDDKYKYDSKHRLSKILKKKVETTMIGALSSLEEHFHSCGLISLAANCPQSSKLCMILSKRCDLKFWTRETHRPATLTRN